MLAGAKRQVFASDKRRNHISEGKRKSEEKERRERRIAMVALLVFILATAWWKRFI